MAEEYKSLPAIAPEVDYKPRLKLTILPESNKSNSGASGSWDEGSGASADYSESTLDKLWNNLTGWDGRERYQLWPEKMIRSAITLPGDVYSGEEPIYNPETGHISDRVIERAQDTSGLMGGTSFANPADGAVVGTFAGKKAITANAGKLDKAIDMTMQGRTPEEIWEKTGWHNQSPDKEWRWEIDDSKASFTPKGIESLNDPNFTPKLAQVLYHPDLYAAYPQLRQLPVELQSEPGATFHGNKITINKDLLNNPKTLLHEIQHGVQGLENFAGGGNPAQSFEDHFTQLKWNAFQIIEKAKENPTPQNVKAAEDATQAVLKANENRDSIGIDRYRRLVGEVESRNVENRSTWDALDRKLVAPWRSQSVPYDEQIMAPSYPFTLKQEGGVPGAGVAALGNSQAPRFYSGLENAIVGISQNKASPDQWLGMLKNSKGVKPEELEWLGVPQWLSEQKGPVSKQDLENYINQNKVELKEVQYGKMSPEEMQANKQRYEELQKKAYSNEKMTPEESREYDKLHSDYLDWNEGDNSKYSEYQVPGGKNYKEFLLSLPENKNGEFNLYRSPHWNEPNVLAHVRTNERDVSGKPSLHIEEIQSDWHQAGRDKGYKGQEIDPKKWLNDRGFNTDGMSDESILKSAEEANWKNRGVPNAPFKKTWHELALKRMIRQAAEQGLDRVSWTPGELNRTNPKNLGDASAEGGKADLGIRKFYNEIIPNSIAKIGKEFGVKVQKGETVTGYTLKDKKHNYTEGNYPTRKAAEYRRNPGEEVVERKEPVYYFDIPEKMKDSALQKGFPLFARGLPFSFTSVDHNPFEDQK